MLFPLELFHDASQPRLRLPKRREPVLNQLPQAIQDIAPKKSRAKKNDLPTRPATAALRAWFPHLILCLNVGFSSNEPIHDGHVTVPGGDVERGDSVLPQSIVRSNEVSSCTAEASPGATTRRLARTNRPSLRRHCLSQLSECCIYLGTGLQIFLILVCLRWV